jgi:hypothetical protein
MGLEEDAVDLLEVNGAGLIPDRFDEGADAQIPGAAQEALGGTDDEGERVLGEGVVPQSGPVELVEEEALDGLGSEAWQERGIGDAGADFLVDGKSQRLHERGLADEDEVVTAGEVLEQEAQLPQAVAVHEMGVVDDGYEHFPGAVKPECLLDEEALALAVAAVELDLEGFAKDAKGIVVGVQCPVDHGSDDAFGIVGHEGVLEHALAGAGFSEHQAQPALLGVNAQDLEDLLLVR